MGTISIDPISRIEGHLDVEVVVENGRVQEVHSGGPLFRGFELILQDRDPEEAIVLSQRICGVCPPSHAMAAALCVDQVFGISGQISKNARIIRNLILGSNFLQSDILHFYQLMVLDYVDITAVGKYNGTDADLNSVKDFIKRGALGPFVPRYQGDYRLSVDANIAASKHYIEALNVRAAAHEMLCIFGGKMPHQCGITAGGVSVKPTTDGKTNFLWRLNAIRAFIDDIFLPDVIAIAKYYNDYFSVGAGCGRFLSYGVFDLEDNNPDQVTRHRFIRQGLVDKSLNYEKPDIAKITEDIKYSWFEGENNLPPADGETDPDPKKQTGYSFVKSPRYHGQAVEAGPIAHILVNYALRDETTRKTVDNVLKQLNVNFDSLFSIMGRNIARVIECKLVADAMANWVLELDPNEPCFTPPPEPIPGNAEGFGISGAPRGAIGHWMKIEKSKIKNYQVITPSTWNNSPRDAGGTPGPMEQALKGLAVNDEKNPFEIIRAIRAFDPCMACAAHVIKPSGAVIGNFHVL
jgi:hydrogenase large subunit